MVNEKCTFTYDVKITCDCCGALGLHEPSTTESMSAIRERLRERGWFFRYVFYRENDQSRLTLMALCGVCLGPGSASWFRTFLLEQERQDDART